MGDGELKHALLLGMISSRLRRPGPLHEECDEPSLSHPPGLKVPQFQTWLSSMIGIWRGGGGMVL